MASKRVDSAVIFRKTVREELEKFLDLGSIPYRTGCMASAVSWFRTGGQIDYLIEPTSKEQFGELIAVLESMFIPFKVIGSTSNLLFLDDVRYPCLISTVGIKGLEIESETGRIRCGAGETLPDLSRFALLNSIAGFAGMEGIPGTVGGAIFMNASAYGDGIHLVLDEVKVVDPDGTSRLIRCDELDFSYRNSAFKSGKIKSWIVEAWFHSKPGDPEALYRKMELVHAKRHRYHEYMYPNLGSAFSGSIYKALGKRSLKFKVVASLFYLVNYKLKLFRRESPINRAWLNEVAMRDLDLERFRGLFSDKTLNTITNRGQHSSEFVAYLEELEKLLEGRVPIENEIVGEL